MSDAFFDAMRASGEYPPKGWGWRDASNQRELLHRHFSKEYPEIEPWMMDEALRLGMIETATCTICAAEDCPGFYKGCAVKDGHVNDWKCNGTGGLFRLVEAA